MATDLLTAIDGPIATMTFNRPEARNSLSDDMVADLKRFLARVEADPEIRCVVVKGAGDHFMAGGDVKSFATMVQEMSGAERRTLIEERIHQLHPVIFTMRRMPQPILASVQGAAAGFGLSFLLACDLAIAADTAFFTLAYIHIGTSPDGSGTFFLPRTVGRKKALEIALFGERFDAATATDLGIVNWVVPEAELAARTAKIAARIAAGPPRAIANTKRLLNASLDNPMETQLNLEAISFADCAATDDWAEGVRAFAEKRPPEFKGA